MRAEQVLERYVREVVEQLPVRMRADVALELASLLHEDLWARVEAAGSSPSEALAIEVMQAFGHPRDVANRYHQRWAIIDPSDTRNFILTVVIGCAMIVAASVPTALLSPAKPNAVGTFLLWWVGVSTLAFGIKSWARRKWPERHRWTPNDPDRANRVGLIAIIVGIGISIALYAEPQRIFAWLTGGHPLPGTLVYDPGFRALGLPWLFAVWIGQALMLAAVAFRGRWSPQLRSVEIALNLTIVALLAWFRADGPVMALAVPNAVAKAFMAMIALFLLIDTGVKLYRRAGQVSAVKLQEALGR